MASAEDPRPQIEGTQFLYPGPHSSLEDRIDERRDAIPLVGESLFESITRFTYPISISRFDKKDVEIRTRKGRPQERDHIDARLDLTPAEWEEFLADEALYGVYMLVAGIDPVEEKELQSRLTEEIPEEKKDEILEKLLKKRFEVTAIGMRVQSTDWEDEGAYFDMSFRFMVVGTTPTDEAGEKLYTNELKSVNFEFSSRSNSLHLKEPRHPDPRMQAIRSRLRQISPDEGRAPSEDVLDIVESGAQVFTGFLKDRMSATGEDVVGS